MSVAPSAVAVLIASGLAVVSALKGTWAVGGSDSSCYGLMAEAFANGELQPSLPLAPHARWPDAARTFTPGGFIPSTVRPNVAAPICAPGFALLLTPFRLLGGSDGIFLFTPIAAAFLVWCTFAAARNLAGDAAGILAAIVIATTPIVLFQAVQPMNDITTAMLWAAVFAAAASHADRRWWVIGALTGMALLVRPNLALTGVVVAIWVLVVARSRRAMFLFAAAALPGVALLLMLNWALYGSPLRVGYGNASELFSLSHVSANVAHYGRASYETLTPFPLLALVAPYAVASKRRSLVWLAFGIAASTTIVYLAYRPYPEWWYLRFLLPAIAPAIVLASAVTVFLLRRSAWIAVIAVGLAVFGVRVAVERQAFDLQRLESRFRHASEVVRERLPNNALLFTVWQSGTVRYHAQRQAVLWDSLDAASLDDAIGWGAEHGYEPYLLLERWEEPGFRERFATRSTFGALDWPPRFEIDRQVRIYVPADRARYFAGHDVPTEYVFAR